MYKVQVCYTVFHNSVQLDKCYCYDYEYYNYYKYR